MEPLAAHLGRVPRSRLPRSRPAMHEGSSPSEPSNRAPARYSRSPMSSSRCSPGFGPGTGRQVPAASPDAAGRDGVPGVYLLQGTDDRGHFLVAPIARIRAPGRPAAGPPGRPAPASWRRRSGRPGRGSRARAGSRAPRLSRCRAAPPAGKLDVCPGSGQPLRTRRPAPVCSRCMSRPGCRPRFRGFSYPSAIAKPGTRLLPASRAGVHFAGPGNGGGNGPWH
jgi:hypothetical protein